MSAVQFGQISQEITKSISSNFESLVEGTFVEEARNLASQEGMSERYINSIIFIKTGTLSGFVELDYFGDDDEPLGVWFEKGTQDHKIEPDDAAALSWIAGGFVRAFSKGHMVSGIEPKRIMERAMVAATPKLRQQIVQKTSNEFKIGTVQNKKISRKIKPKRKTRRQIVSEINSDLGPNATGADKLRELARRRN